MAGKGSAFGLGGCGCLTLFALAALLAVLAGGRVHANLGGMLCLLVIGGIAGLIVLLIYNQGREDAILESQPKKPVPPAEPVPCASCGTMIPNGSSVCPKCGWTYTKC
jgi:hypothetical protein